MVAAELLQSRIPPCLQETQQTLRRDMLRAVVFSTAKVVLRVSAAAGGNLVESVLLKPLCTSPVALALDSTGFARISYFDFALQKPKCAYDTPELSVILLLGLGLPAVATWRRQQTKP